jgi:hypothetical protein
LQTRSAGSKSRNKPAQGNALGLDPGTLEPLYVGKLAADMVRRGSWAGL